VEILADRKTLLCDFDAGGGPERIFKAIEIAEAVRWRRLGPE
jgi:hypothetical protein